MILLLSKFRAKCPILRIGREWQCRNYSGAKVYLPYRESGLVLERESDI
jgi:hypothetical protein